MRRRGDRDLRRRVGRRPVFDDVQYLHDVGEFSPQPWSDPVGQLIMGQRHQLFVIAKIANQYRGLAVDWGYYFQVALK